MFFNCEELRTQTYDLTFFLVYIYIIINLVAVVYDVI